MNTSTDNKFTFSQAAGKIFDDLKALESHLSAIRKIIADENKTLKDIVRQVEEEEAIWRGTDSLTDRNTYINQVLPNFMYTCHFLAIFARIEAELGDCAWFAAVSIRDKDPSIEADLKECRTLTIEASKEYINRYLKVTGRSFNWDTPEWQALKWYQYLRNLVVHNLGLMRSLPKDHTHYENFKKVKACVGRKDTLAWEEAPDGYFTIRFSPEFCSEVISHGRGFFKQIYN